MDVSRFWYKLPDATTGRYFYANSVTGQCCWQPPPNVTFIENAVPEWWELFDDNTNCPYYFNTITQETVWEYPRGIPFVPIPLTSADDAKIRRCLVDSIAPSVLSPSQQSVQSDKLSTVPTTAPATATTSSTPPLTTTSSSGYVLPNNSAPISNSLSPSPPNDQANATRPENSVPLADHSTQPASTAAALSVPIGAAVVVAQMSGAHSASAPPTPLIATSLASSTSLPSSDSTPTATPTSISASNTSTPPTNTSASASTITPNEFPSTASPPQINNVTSPNNTNATTVTSTSLGEVSPNTSDTPNFTPQQLEFINQSVGFTSATPSNVHSNVTSSPQTGSYASQNVATAFGQQPTAQNIPPVASAKSPGNPNKTPTPIARSGNLITLIIDTINTNGEKIAHNKMVFNVEMTFQQVKDKLLQKLSLPNEAKFWFYVPSLKLAIALHRTIQSYNLRNEENIIFGEQANMNFTPPPAVAVSNKKSSKKGGSKEKKPKEKKIIFIPKRYFTGGSKHQPTQPNQQTPQQSSDDSKKRVLLRMETM
jgi:hypothetical protein